MPHPTCATCLTIGGPTVSARGSADRLHSKADVYAKTGGPQASATTHLVHELLAIYTTQDMLECALPDKTLHRWGAVVRTKCGRVLHIGRECALKHVPEMDRLLKKDAELDVYEKNVAAIEGAGELLKQSLATAADVVRLDLVLDLLSKKAPSLFQKMQDFATGAAENRYDVDRRGPLGVSVETFKVHGTGAFARARPDSHAIRGLASKVQAARDDGAIEQGRARAVRRNLDELRRVESEARRWLNEAHAFFRTEANLALAIRLSDDDSVDVLAMPMNGGEAVYLVLENGARVNYDGVRPQPDDEPP